MKIFTEVLLLMTVGLLHFKSAGGIRGLIPFVENFLSVRMEDGTFYTGHVGAYDNNFVPVWLTTEEVYLVSHYVYIRTPYFVNYRGTIFAPDLVPPNHNHLIHTPWSVRIRLGGNEHYSGNNFDVYPVRHHHHQSGYPPLIQADLPDANNIYIVVPGRGVFFSPLVPYW